MPDLNLHAGNNIPVYNRFCYNLLHLFSEFNSFYKDTKILAFPKMVLYICRRSCVYNEKDISLRHWDTVTALPVHTPSNKINVQIDVRLLGSSLELHYTCFNNKLLY